MGIFKMAAPMKRGTTHDESEFPKELQDRLKDFDTSLNEIEELLLPLFETPLNERHEQMTPLDKAKLDLTAVYAIYSLFWMYLNARGEDPKEHAVKQELDRVRSYMARIKEIQDREKAPRLNKDASKRFVRNALWQAAHAQASQAKADASEEKPGTSKKGSEVSRNTEDSEAPTKKQKISSDFKKQKKKKNKK